METKVIFGMKMGHLNMHLITTCLNNIEKKKILISRGTIGNHKYRFEKPFGIYSLILFKFCFLLNILRNFVYFHL